MKDYKSVLEKIRVILGMETIDKLIEDEQPEVVELAENPEPEVVVEETTEVKLSEVVLEDGTIIYYDADAFGNDVAIFVDELMETPVGDGAYVLEDGNTFKVVEGKVTELAPVEVPETEEAEEVPLEDDFEKKYNDLKIVIDELKSKLGKFEATEVELKSEIKKLSTEPEVVSVTQTPQDKRELSSIEKRMNTLDAIRKLRKK